MSSRLSCIAFSRSPLLCSNHIIRIPKHLCQQIVPGNALKHKPRNEHQFIHQVYLREIIQGNTIHSHYHFHYCDWWRRNHHLMFTYFAFGVFSCTMESPYLSLVVAPFCIAALLHQRYFHYSPSISMNITLYIRMKHQNPGNGEHPLKTQTIQVQHSTTSEMPLYNRLHSFPPATNGKGILIADLA